MTLYRPLSSMGRGANSFLFLGGSREGVIGAPERAWERGYLFGHSGFHGL